MNDIESALRELSLLRATLKEFERDAYNYRFLRDRVAGRDGPYIRIALRGESLDEAINNLQNDMSRDGP